MKRIVIYGAGSETEEIVEVLEGKSFQVEVVQEWSELVFVTSDTPDCNVVVPYPPKTMSGPLIHGRLSSKGWTGKFIMVCEKALYTKLDKMVHLLS